MKKGAANICTGLCIGFLLVGCSDNNSVAEMPDDEQTGLSDPQEWRTGSVNPSNAERIATSLVTFNASVMSIVELVDQLTVAGQQSNCSGGAYALSVVAGASESTDSTTVSLDNCVLSIAGSTLTIDGALKFTELASASDDERVMEIDAENLSVGLMLAQRVPSLTGRIIYTRHSTGRTIVSPSLRQVFEFEELYTDLDMTVDSLDRSTIAARFSGYELSAPVSTGSALSRETSWYCLAGGSISLVAKDDSYVSVTGNSGQSYDTDLNGNLSVMVCPIL